jgi:hypothetical protein
MPKDVIVVVNIDAKPRPAERLDILLISTAGAQPFKIYRSLDEILADYPAQAGVNQRVYNKASAMFNQGKTTLADTLIRRIGVVGFDPPETATGSLSVYSITFSLPQFTTPLDPDTDYWVQIGNNAQAVVQITTGTSAPTTGPQMAQLFDGVTFTLNGVVFTGAAGTGGVVTFTGDVMTATVPLTTTVEFFADNALTTAMGIQATAYSATYANGGPPMAPADALIADIRNLQETENDWYVFLTDQDGDDFVTALSAFAEESEPTEAELGAGEEDYRKFYFGQTDNRFLAGQYRRSAIVYTDTDLLTEEADAAFLGNVGPFWPRSVTWKFKRPQGITLPDITFAQREQLEEVNINFLTEEYKRQYMKNGVCWDGEFIDVQMGADYIAYFMRERLYDILLENAKIGYTDEGFAIVAAGVFATLNRATDLGIIATDPEAEAGIFHVYVPRRADASDDQARSRAMPDIVWEALLEGAVHSVKVTGTLRATLSA